MGKLWYVKQQSRENMYAQNAIMVIGNVTILSVPKLKLRIIRMFTLWR